MGIHPVAFESKKLTDAELKYLTHEKELYAIITNFWTFRNLENVREY